MIPVYNAAAALSRSLASVVEQTGDQQDMQIEVVDDCSNQDDPQAVVKELGGGRVSFFRQPSNVGHSRTFNSCIVRARGELVHLLHADDWVGDGFYEKVTEVFAAHPEIGAAFCRHAVMNPDGSTQWVSPLERETPGIINGWLERIAGEQRVQAPSMVVRRAVYERLGGFDTRITCCGEDWEMWVRIALHYPVGYVPELLAFYQDTPESLTKRTIRTGQNIKDLRLATRIVRSYLPTVLAERTAPRALQNWADLALRWARLAAAKGNYRSAVVQIHEALRCRPSPSTFRQAARVAGSGLRHALGRGSEASPARRRRRSER
jgi:glycosyltransferase involved in cell wall biosynthesis